MAFIGGLKKQSGRFGIGTPKETAVKDAAMPQWSLKFLSPTRRTLSASVRQAGALSADDTEARCAGSRPAEFGEDGQVLGIHDGKRPADSTPELAFGRKVRGCSGSGFEICHALKLAE